MVDCMIQARMGSSRLPGKVLTVAAGKTFLEHTIERLRHAKSLKSIYLLTSTLAQDDSIEKLAESNGVPVFRGSESDVLDRYYKAAVRYSSKSIVRITADCPLIDPVIVDKIVSIAEANVGNYDLVTNRHPLTFPDGMDVDVIPFESLKAAWENASTPFQREHVIPYFWESGMKVLNIECEENLFSSHRWTVDYYEDALLVAAIFNELYSTESPFHMSDILRFLEQKPHLSELNKKYLPNKAN